MHLYVLVQNFGKLFLNDELLLIRIVIELTVEDIKSMLQLLCFSQGIVICEVY